MTGLLVYFALAFQASELPNAAPTVVLHAPLAAPLTLLQQVPSTTTQPKSSSAISQPQPGTAPAGTNATPPAAPAAANPVSISPTSSSTPPAATTGPGGLKASFGDKRAYESHLESARAYVEVNDKVKAVGAYEQAVLSAPDDASKQLAERELKDLGDWQDNEWLTPALVVLRSLWVWFALFLGLLLFILLCRFLRWCATPVWPKRKYHVRVDSESGNELVGYFRGLIRFMRHAFDDQYRLIEGLGAADRTVRPAFQSSSLYANVPLSMGLTKINEHTWWLPFLARAIERVRPADYDVDVCIHHPKDHWGITVSLERRSTIIGQWHRSGPDADLANAMADLAYAVVVVIVADSMEEQ